MGNRLTDSAVPGAWTYNENNQLLGHGDVTWQYDANGNAVKKTAGTNVLEEYVYDTADRLVQVKDASGNVVANYCYDPAGRRLWKEVNNTRTYFLYSDEGLIAEANSTGTITKLYGYRSDSPTWNTDPLYLKEGGNYYFFQNDHLGTPQKLTDTQGSVVWSARAQAFGQTSVETASTVTNNLRFPGQYYDAETGLHYNWNRYYDPKLGRYLTSDPIGLEGELNTYAYVANNPLRFIDPFGLAYLAKRPLAGSPWLGPASCNPIDDFFNTEISHEQLFFEDGKNPSNIGFFDDGTLKTEPNPTGYRCRSGKYNDCIMRKAVANTGPLPSYCLIGRNCQTWAARVRAEYARLAQDPQVQKECEPCKQ